MRFLDDAVKVSVSWISGWVRLIDTPFGAFRAVPLAAWQAAAGWHPALPAFTLLRLCRLCLPQ